MRKIVCRVKSKSDPTKKYKVERWHNGDCYCDCWAWKKDALQKGAQCGHTVKAKKDWKQ
jgi:hypothetical protein